MVQRRQSPERNSRQEPGAQAGQIRQRGGQVPLDPARSSAFDVMLEPMAHSRLTLVTVHPVLLGTLKCRNSSLLRLDRVDNRLKAHS